MIWRRRRRRSASRDGERAGAHEFESEERVEAYPQRQVRDLPFVLLITRSFHVRFERYRVQKTRTLPVAFQNTLGRHSPRHQSHPLSNTERRIANRSCRWTLVEAGVPALALPGREVALEARGSPGATDHVPRVERRQPPRRPVVTTVRFQSDLDRGQFQRTRDGHVALQNTLHHHSLRDQSHPLFKRQVDAGGGRASGYFAKSNEASRPACNNRPRFRIPLVFESG